MNPKKIMILVRKDLLDAARTPRLAILILLPVLISVATNLFFRNELSFRIAIFSPTPSQLTENLRAVEVIKLTPLDTEGAVRDSVSRKTNLLGVILPPNFDRSLQDKQSPKVLFVLADNGRSSQSALSIVQQVIQSLVVEKSPIVSSVEVLLPETDSGVSLRGGLGLDKYTIVLWLVMGLATNGVLLVPTLVMEERERKTLDALLLSPLSYADVICSKALVGVFYSVLSGLLVLLLQGGLQNDIWSLLAILLMGSMALSLLGVLVGGLAKNLQTLNSYGGLLIFPLILPAMVGVLGPNRFVQYLQFLPTYHLTQGIALAMNGKGSQIGLNLAWLIIQCFVIFFVVVWSLRRREV